jgi:hypothetical protein
MLKITSIAIGLLTTVTMASNAQAMPAEVHAQSFQRPIPTTNVRAVVVANNRRPLVYQGRHQVAHRPQVLPVRTVVRRHQHNSRVVYKPQHREVRGHYARRHSNIRYYR